MFSNKRHLPYSHVSPCVISASWNFTGDGGCIMNLSNFMNKFLHFRQFDQRFVVMTDRYDTDKYSVSI